MWSVAEFRELRGTICSWFVRNNSFPTNFEQTNLRIFFFFYFDVKSENLSSVIEAKVSDGFTEQKYFT